MDFPPITAQVAPYRDDGTMGHFSPWEIMSVMESTAEKLGIEKQGSGRGWATATLKVFCASGRHA